MILKIYENKVSFDFDGTLSRPEIQKYAAELIARGIEVWIVTARVIEFIFENNKTLEIVEAVEGLQRPFIPIYGYNLRKEKRHEDLLDVADKLGIPYERVIFVGGYTDYKLEYLNHLGFAFHIDDDWEELKHFHIQKDTIDVLPVNAALSSRKEDCETILNNLNHV